jgi:predicted Zn-dependent protease
MTSLFFRGLLASLLLLHAATALSENNFDELPNLGDTSGQIISPEQDRALGAYFMRQLRQFTFFMVNDSSINAFAGPGGYIGINTGLLTAAKSESELAGVMAHEIAHVTQRHLARGFEASDRMSGPRLAAMAAALLIGTQDAGAGAAAFTAASAASLQYQINFTRANEKEADRIGIQSLANAGFDPNGMAGFFERLQQNSRLYGARPPEFLSTHPVTTNRISEATSRAQSYPKIHLEPNLEFQLLQVKLRVNSYENPSQVLADVYRYKGESGGDTLVERYEFALLLEANNKFAEASKIIGQLHESDQNRVTYRLALARILYKGKQVKPSLDIYASSLELYPDSLVVILPYATTLLSAKQAETAFELLADSSNKHPLNPEVYNLLARAAGETNRKVQTHTAMSQYFFLNGYTTQAIEQLQLAEKQPGLSNYQTSLIQEGIKNLESTMEKKN